MTIDQGLKKEESQWEQNNQLENQEKVIRVLGDHQEKGTRGPFLILMLLFQKVAKMFH